MFNAHLWKKGLCKGPFKRATEHYFHAFSEEDQLKKSFVNSPVFISKSLNEFANTASSTKQVHAFASPCFDKKIQLLSTKQLNVPASVTFSTTSLLNSVSSFPVISTISYSTNATNHHDVANKPAPSVLGSMGLESKPVDDLKANEEKEKQDNKGKEDETDNKETPFLRSQRYAKWTLLVTLVVGTPMFVLQYGAPGRDEFGDEIIDQYSNSNLVLAYIQRAWGEIKDVRRDIVEPSSKKLLPDPLKEPYYQPPYTLVIELMDVFLRPVYDSVSGWRFKKRPGIDYFLSQVGPPLFEVVIFTRETGMTAFPLIDSMDQKGFIMYRLFRDAARYKSGFSLGNPLQGEMPKLEPYYQKDLTYLNRDLSKVILIDCDKRACEKQPENGLCLDKWDGSSNDTTLYDLAGLLKAIATSNVEDVRPVLQHYAQNDKPIETFKMAQVKMQQDSQYAVQSGKTHILAGAGSTVSSFFKRR